ncbi:MAG: T9SS type A sorting domain-containing protein, partial [Phaeodactylibacter sp.]|nr:T9SS type A sorting domain-containing protein [Phaeodactylibacter sp.]
GTLIENYAQLYYDQLPEITTDTVFNTYTRCGTPDPELNMMIFPGPEMMAVEICLGDSVEVGGSYYAEAGNFFIEMTSADGCDSSLILNLSHLPPIELDNVEIVHDDGTNNGSITPTFSGGMPPYTYEWANGAIEPMIFGLTGGEYTLFVTDAGGCTASFHFSITEPSGSAEPGKPELYIAPNPVVAGHGVLVQGEAATLQCFNSQGQLIPLQVRREASGLSLTAPAQSGIYWLRCQSADQSFLLKLVVVD